jgi:hypothetical protein
MKSKMVWLAFVIIIMVALRIIGFIYGWDVRFFAGLCLVAASIVIFIWLQSKKIG